jgi:hypothetical protein
VLWIISKSWDFHKGKRLFSVPFSS